MAQVEYTISQFYDPKQAIPSIHVSTRAEASDPLEIRTNKALGGDGIIPPYNIPIRSKSLIEGQMPLRLKRSQDKSWYQFKIEPIVLVGGKNIIIRRSVAKSKGLGTIKERWSQDDYVITIKGIIIGENEQVYPTEQVAFLQKICSEKESIEVIHEFLMSLGIRFMAIESLNFIETKGINNQKFEIKGYSDQGSELLIEV